MAFQPDDPVIRSEWRARCAEGVPEEALAEAFAAGKAAAEAAVQAGRVMTAALYRYGRQLFLYLEPVGEESLPESLLAGMAGALDLWPQKEETARWVRMYPVFWHCVPGRAEDWLRRPARERRRGRIAYLKPETMFEYVYHHFALTQEGRFPGDRYMFISLHEDVLFSYFEEPRSSESRLGTAQPSEAITPWLACDPDSLFRHLPGSNGQNFLLLPAVWDVGM